jgi:hypothetical protein
MITGDHAATATSIARQLGIEGATLTGADLDRLDDAALPGVVASTGVFARVAPEHKIRLVRALQAQGHVVAMTGDGVNDAPALKGADIGVAMGITGTEVSKEAADMVLTDDDFATIVHAVEGGRTIYDNILKFVRFQLSTNLGAILSLLGAQIAGLPVPFTAIQVLWVNLIMDGPPAMALGVDPPAAGVMDRTPRAAGRPHPDRSTAHAAPLLRRRDGRRHARPAGLGDRDGHRGARAVDGVHRVRAVPGVQRLQRPQRAPLRLQPRLAPQRQAVGRARCRRGPAGARRARRPAPGRLRHLAPHRVGLGPRHCRRLERPVAGGDQEGRRAPPGSVMTTTDARRSDERPRSSWTFLTNHAHVLVCIAEEPDVRGRDIAAKVGITEHSVQAIVADLVADGYLTRTREGRRNRYEIHPGAPLRHPLEEDHTVGELLASLGRPPPATRSNGR